MRIITGQWRGRILPPPVDGVRPTPDRAREALFSILGSRGIPFAETRWLDLWAGSGAIGLEALSRGAAHVTFVDASRKVIARLQGFLERVGGADRAKIVQATLPRQFAQVAHGLAKPVDVVFADPPFREAPAPDHLLGDPDFLRVTHPGTLVIWEREARQPALTGIPGWTIDDVREYGRVEFTFLERDG